MTPQSATLNHPGAVRSPAATSDYFLRRGLLKLLAVKDSDVRLLCLEQCRDAVDKSLHAGGAFSATIPLVALYYGGFMNIDVTEPTRRGRDLFVLNGLAINTLDRDGRPQYIHSGTYEELVEAFALTPSGIANAVRARMRP